jgi:DNA transformation protein and related proteins
MARRPEFVDYVVDQMSFILGLRVRPMFGGHGVYRDALMFAIIVSDTLYLKTDALVQRDFEEKGLSPFSYVARGKTVTLRYYEAPPEVFEEPDAMRIWTEKALGASIRQGAHLHNKAPRRTRNKAPRR